MEPYWVAVLFFWLLCGIYGSEIGKQKQAGTEGFWIGILLGPVGVIAAGFFDRRPRCPECGGALNNTKTKLYRICQHCKCDLMRDDASPKPAVDDADSLWTRELDDARQRLEAAKDESHSTPVKEHSNGFNSCET